MDKYTEGKEDFINYTDFSNRVASKLYSHGFTTIQSLIEKTPRELLEIDGFGCHSLSQVRKYLAKRGLNLKDDSNYKKKLDDIEYDNLHIIRKVKSLCHSVKITMNEIDILMKVLDERL